MQLFDPFRQRQLTTGPYAFAVPPDQLSRRDLKRVARRGRRERSRLLRLSPLTGSPMEVFYQQAINQGRLEVLRQRLEYARGLGESYLAAEREAVANAQDPPEPTLPSAVAPEAGVAHTSWLVDRRRYAAWEAECQRRSTAAAAADFAMRNAELELEVINHFAATAIATWEVFYDRLLALHYDAVAGSDNANPTRRRLQLERSAEPLPLPPLVLRHLPGQAAAPGEDTPQLAPENHQPSEEHDHE